jgi:hypothetical protein
MKNTKETMSIVRTQAAKTLCFKLVSRVSAYPPNSPTSDRNGIHRTDSRVHMYLESFLLSTSSSLLLHSLIVCIHRYSPARPTIKRTAMKRDWIAPPTVKSDYPYSDNRGIGFTLANTETNPKSTKYSHIGNTKDSAFSVSKLRLTQMKLWQTHVKPSMQITPD